MAHLAKLGGLTEELVTIITSFSPNNHPTEFNRLRDTSLRSLRHHNYGRTDQFDIATQADGLVEKFSVHGKDALAEALDKRLKMLPSLGLKWTPEILHLLLELSDRPSQNSKVDDLDHLKEPEPDPGPPLKWKELVAEDPLLRDKHVWRNVDFTADSSEDDFEDALSYISEPTTVESSIDEGRYDQLSRLTIIASQEDNLEDLRKAQFWLTAPSVGGIKLETVKKPITDLEAVREVLFMLSGLPTFLFELSPKTNIVQPVTNYAIHSADHYTSYKLMEEFAIIGTAIHVLRSWVKTRQSVSLLQVFQNCVGNKLRAFDEFLSSVEERFVAAESDIVVSLLSIRTQVNELARPLERLSSLVAKHQQERYAHAFHYLELLYDETCTLQMAGDDGMYTFMGNMFFDCFQAYLSPLREWMEEGDLEEGDKVFFVSESVGSTDLGSIWQSRYKRRQSQAGVLHAPRFLHAAVNKIFNTGKSVVVLKHLNRSSLLHTAGRNWEPQLTFKEVCTPSMSLAPFSELFGSAFDRWVQSKHQQASDNLREILFDNCGLQTALDGLINIYFMADGATSAVFTDHVFNRLDTLDQSWRDRFTLAEIAQSTFGTITSVAADRIRTKILTLPQRVQDVVDARRTVRTLAALLLTYQLSWPIQIIVKPETIASYQRIFTFLFQVRRSTYIITRQRLVKDTLTHTSNSDERALYYSLRTRLLWFNQALYHYLTTIVLQVRAQRVKKDLRAAEYVDSMIAVHSAFIKLAVDQSLLGSRLELIQKTIVKTLDIGIKLEDAQSANAVASRAALEQQQEMMDRSMASLGLHTPQRKGRATRNISYAKSSRRQALDSSSEDEAEEQPDVDMSILSSPREGEADLSFTSQIRKMRADFDRQVRFVASGLKGVARAGGGEAAKSWDLLGEILEAGIGSDGGF